MRKRREENIRGQTPSYTTSQGVKSEERYIAWIKPKQQQLDRLILEKLTKNRAS